MREIGILGGTFNPVHAGHLMVADYVRQTAGLDAVWLSLSPANPLKERDNATTDAQRLEMLQIAVDRNEFLNVTDIELSLPRPSFTIDFLRHIAAIFPECKFKLIIGSDNWLIFDRWRAHDEILNEFGVIIYPRPGFPLDNIDDPRATLITAPGIDISSTFIRDAIRNGLDMNFFLPPGVYSYIKQNNLYQ